MATLFFLFLIPVAFFGAMWGMNQDTFGVAQYLPEIIVPPALRIKPRNVALRSVPPANVNPSAANPTPEDNANPPTPDNASNAAPTAPKDPSEGNNPPSNPDGPSTPIPPVKPVEVTTPDDGKGLSATEKPKSPALEKIGDNLPKNAVDSPLPKVPDFPDVNDPLGKPLKVPDPLSDPLASELKMPAKPLDKAEIKPLTDPLDPLAAQGKPEAKPAVDPLDPLGTPAKPEAKPAVDPLDPLGTPAKTEAKPEAKPAADPLDPLDPLGTPNKPEAKSALKPAVDPLDPLDPLGTPAKPEAKPEVKPAAVDPLDPLAVPTKPEVKAEAKPEVKPVTDPLDSIPAPAKPEAKPDAKPLAKPAADDPLDPLGTPAKPEVKPAVDPLDPLSIPAKPDVKPEVKPAVKPAVDPLDPLSPGGIPDAKPPVSPEAKPEVKPEGTPDSKPAVKPAADPLDSLPAPAPEAKPEAKPELKPKAEAKAVALKNAPSYKAEDVASAGKAASEATAVLAATNPSDRAAINKARAAYYKALCRLSDTITFSPESAPERIEASTLIKKLANDRSRSEEVGALGNFWLGAPVRKSENENGIVLVGKVKESKPQGNLYATTLVLIGKTPKEVVLISDAKPAVAADGSLLVLGSIVGKPAENVPGYQGREEEIVWVGQGMNLDTPDQPAFEAK